MFCQISGEERDAALNKGKLRAKPGYDPFHSSARFANNGFSFDLRRCVPPSFHSNPRGVM